MTSSADTPLAMPEQAVALEIAAEVARIALGYQEGIVAERKADRTVVTAADRAVDAYVRDRLHRAFPEDALLSEETEDDPDRLGRSRVWIIDPIDGTRGFIDQSEEWAIHIGLVVDGALRLGVVALPGRDEILCGRPGRGATRLRAGTSLPLRVPADPPPIVLASRRLEADPHPIMAALAGYGWEHCHSVGYKVARMLAGEAALYIHPQTIFEWDVAAPASVLLAAGGAVCDYAGRDFAFNQPEPRCAGLIFSCKPDPAAIVSGTGAPDA